MTNVSFSTPAAAAPVPPGTLAPVGPAAAALVVLEDGRAFLGRRFGATGEAAGEVVFNTSMTGYQEILSDPSYAGQIVVMTSPMIGNCGIAAEDFEARRPHLAALVVKEPSRLASNWRLRQSLPSYMAEQGIVGVYDLDTRALVRHLRARGVMRGVIGNAEAGIAPLLARARSLPSMAGLDLATRTSLGERYGWQEECVRLPSDPPRAATGPAALHVVAYDFGIKWNILRHLRSQGCRVTVVPASFPAEEVLAMQPDGVLLSNGPGDPEPVRVAVENTKRLLGRVPIFGICLGHQLLGLACGARTYKLKFGHRGGNHPVQDLATRRVEITSHNHGFAVDPQSLPDDVECTHVDLDDQTLEGLRHKVHPAFSVQYHPEAAPGPHDAHPLFARFTALMRRFADERLQER